MFQSPRERDTRVLNSSKHLVPIALTSVFVGTRKYLFCISFIGGSRLKKTGKTMHACFHFIENS